MTTNVKKVKCPVCGDTCEEKSFNKESGMCYRCNFYLNIPADDTAKGADTGVFMWRTQIREYDGSRTMHIRPRGFWSEVITVSERSYFRPGTREWDVTISHSCGGQDGTLHDIDAHKAFAKGLAFAIKTAEKWQKERSK